MTPPKKPRSKSGPRVAVVRLAHGRGLALPAYQTAGAAGLDLAAAVPATAPLRLRPRQRALVPTGLILALPAGFEAQVRPRSGLALRHGVTVLNSPGTIDSDYRGELQVLLVNLSGQAFVVRRGDRIAQLVVQPVARAVLVETTAAAKTRRGASGFGSTGTKAAPATAAAVATTRGRRAVKKSQVRPAVRATRSK